MIKKHILPVLLVFAIILSFTAAASAETQPPEIHAEGAVVMDLKTGRVIYSKNPDEKLYPASTTKILTAIIALEECPDLSEVVTASSNAIAPITLDDSHMGILVGEQLTLNDLLNGMLIYSANDAANVIAVHIAGSLDAFAEKMNRKAGAIGAVNSHFVNPHGYHNDAHYTTANDLAAIARYAMTNEQVSPIFREIVSKTRYEIPPTNKYTQTRYLPTTNHLISRIRNANHFYQPAIGIKTGYTSQAKNCLVAAAEKDGTELLSVVLKCENTDKAGGAYSFVDTRALFEYGFANYKYQTVTAPGSIISDSKVYEAKDGARVALTPEKEIGALLPVNINLAEDIKPEIVVNDNISAPITKGDALGTVTYFYNDENIGSSQLLASNDVERDGFLFVLHGIVKVLTSPVLYICIVLVAALVVALRIKFGGSRRVGRRKYGSRRGRKFK